MPVGPLMWAIAWKTRQRAPNQHCAPEPAFLRVLHVLRVLRGSRVCLGL